VHQFWIDRLTDELQRSGYEVKTEAAVGGGQTVDLRAVKDGRITLIEVEVSGRRLERSVQKLAAGDAQQRVVACASAAMLQRARRTVEASGSAAAVEVVHVWSLLGKPGTRQPPHGS
jgi:hypothetical protein